MRLAKPVGAILLSLVLVTVLGLGLVRADGDPTENGSGQPVGFQGQAAGGGYGAGYGGGSAAHGEYQATGRSASQVAGQIANPQPRGGGYVQLQPNTPGRGAGLVPVVNYANDRDVQANYTANAIRQDIANALAGMGLAPGGGTPGTLTANISSVYQPHMMVSLYRISLSAGTWQTSESGYLPMGNQGLAIRNKVRALMTQFAAAASSGGAGMGTSPYVGRVVGPGTHTGGSCRDDDDCDGVPNYADQCPDTPKGVKVNRLGCPGSVAYGPCLSYTPCARAAGSPCAGQAINPCVQNTAGCAVTAGNCAQPAASPCAPQAGVCPTYGGVQAPMCENDDDCDGVINCRDFCPCTPPGCPVDKCGCTLKGDQEWVVEFDVDKYFIRQGEKDKLNALADVVRSRPALGLMITGNTDSDASDSYNITLSRNRAESVANYLASQRVPRERMRIEYFGERRPRAPNTSAEGKQRNRRVRIRLVTY